MFRYKFWRELYSRHPLWCMKVSAGVLSLCILGQYGILIVTLTVGVIAFFALNICNQLFLTKQGDIILTQYLEKICVKRLQTQVSQEQISREKRTYTETNFGRTRKFSDLVMSENLMQKSVNQELDDILRFFVRDYVLYWYQQISYNEQFYKEVMYALEDLSNGLISRARKVNVNLLSRKLLLTYHSFYRSYAASVRRAGVEKNVSISDWIRNSDDKCNLEEHFKDYHFAVESKEAEIEYLTNVVNILLEVTVPTDVLTCLSGRKLVVEIMARSGLYELFNLIADPDWLNQNVIWLLTTNEGWDAFLQDDASLIEHKVPVKLEVINEPTNQNDDRDDDDDLIWRRMAEEMPTNFLKERERQMSLAFSNSYNDLTSGAAISKPLELPLSTSMDKIGGILNAVSPFEFIASNFNSVFNRGCQEPKSKSNCDGAEAVSNGLTEGVRKRSFQNGGEGISASPAGMGSMESLPESDKENLGGKRKKEISKYSNDGLVCTSVLQDGMMSNSRTTIKQSSIPVFSPRSAIFYRPTPVASTPIADQDDASEIYFNPLDQPSPCRTPSKKKKVVQANVIPNSPTVESAQEAVELFTEAGLDGKKFVLKNIRIPYTEIVDEQTGAQYSLYCVQYDAWYYNPTVTAMTDSSDGEFVNIVTDPVRTVLLRTNTIKKRFREFLRLQTKLDSEEDLKSAVKGLKGPNKWLNLPQGRLNSETAEDRRCFLENYLRILNAIEEVSFSSHFAEFMEYDREELLRSVQRSDSPDATAPRIDRFLVKTVSDVFGKIKTAIPGLPSPNDQSISPCTPSAAEQAPPSAANQLVSGNGCRQSSAGSNGDISRTQSDKGFGFIQGLIPGNFLAGAEVYKLNVQIDFEDNSGESQSAVKVNKLLGSFLSHSHELDSAFEVGGGVIFADSTTKLNRGKANGNISKDTDYDGPANANKEFPLGGALVDLLLECLSFNPETGYLSTSQLNRATKLLVGKYLESWFGDLTELYSSEQMWARYANGIKESLWPEGKVAGTYCVRCHGGNPYECDCWSRCQRQKGATKKRARQLLIDKFSSAKYLAGVNKHEFQIDVFLDMFQHSKLLRSLVYRLLDVIMESFVPEIGNLEFYSKFGHRAKSNQ